MTFNSIQQPQTTLTPHLIVPFSTPQNIPSVSFLPCFFLENPHHSPMLRSCPFNSRVQEVINHEVTIVQTLTVQNLQHQHPSLRETTTKLTQCLFISSYLSFLLEKLKIESHSFSLGRCSVLYSGRTRSDEPLTSYRSNSHFQQLGLFFTKRVGKLEFVNNSKKRGANPTKVIKAPTRF